MDVSKRIENIIKALSMNNSSFAKSLDVSSTTIDGYIKGRKKPNGEIVVSQPNYDIIKKIVAEHNINADYVLGISDCMFKDSKKKIFDLDDLSVDEIVTYIYHNEERRKFEENPTYKMFLEIKAQRIAIKKLSDQKEEVLKEEDKSKDKKVL